MARFPDRGIDVNTGKPVSTSAGRLFGINTIHGADGPYMTRAWIGRLRLHIFHRGDADPDCHDHPFDFTTFPLTPYVEEVLTLRKKPKPDAPDDWMRERQIVPAWRLSFRKADHTHRVLGRWGGKAHDAWARVTPSVVTGKIITIVWVSKSYRQWGFLKERDGKSCWVYWKDYVFGGGKRGPCE